MSVLDEVSSLLLRPLGPLDCQMITCLLTVVRITPVGRLAANWEESKP